MIFCWVSLIFSVGYGDFMNFCWVSLIFSVGYGILIFLLGLEIFLKVFIKYNIFTKVTLGGVFWGFFRPFYSKIKNLVSCGQKCIYKR